VRLVISSPPAWPVATGQPVGVTQDLAVVQPGGMGKVVGDDPRERHPERRLRPLPRWSNWTIR
jgi:hypothetical protein